ncbi:hypothetical protein P3X46_010995, partial [Hevea brasiliensis]
SPIFSISAIGKGGFPSKIHPGKLSVKLDVYSFGVVLLELITGRKSTHEDIDCVKSTHEDVHIVEIHIVDWAKSRIIKALKGEYMNFVDSNLQKYNRREMQRMIFCAASCVYKPLYCRPTIKKIVEALEGHIPPKNIWDENDNKFLHS